MPRDRNTTGAQKPTLRQRAEALFQAEPAQLADLPAKDLSALLNELHVHRIELEMQNEELQIAQRELTKTRDHYTELFDFAPVAYFELNLEGLVLQGNLKAAQLLGVNRQDLVRKPFIRYFAAESQDAVRQLWMNFSNAQVRQIDNLVLRVAGETQIHVTGQCELILSAEQPTFRVALIDTSEQHHAEQQLRTLNATLESRIAASTAELVESQADLRRLLKNTIDRQEQEARKFAREMHDSFGQELAAVGLRLSAIASRSPDPGISDGINEARKSIRQVADHLRQFARETHPGILEELGLEAALCRSSENFTRQTGTPVHLDYRTLSGTLEPERALGLYRIVQEALHNANIHAKATEIRILLYEEPGTVVLQVVDNGCGLDPEKARRQGGLGLVSMEERALLMHGTMKLLSAPGKGCTVEIRVPRAVESRQSRPGKA